MKHKVLKPGVTFYRDNSGKYRWRIVSNNHEIVGASSQGFASRQKAKGNLRLIHNASFELARS
ncbi:MAG: DUF1508 domain-containing protein [Verrucomicrobiota bacterium]